MHEYLFVYGSLRPCNWKVDKMGSRLAEALQRQAHLLGPAGLRGHLYQVDWYPAFVPDVHGSWIRGDLFAMSDTQSLLSLLDEYEEIGPDYPPPQEYRREQHWVSTDTGRVYAWIYVYARPTNGLKPIIGGIFRG